MAKQEFEFTLILSGAPDLTVEVLDAFYEAGCDDALIGMRDGAAYADFCREADSFNQAALSAIRDVESAGVGANVAHIESAKPRRSGGDGEAQESLDPENGRRPWTALTTVVREPLSNK